MGCALRRGFGRFYYRVLVCAPALISSYLSLQIEKPARRQALAFYMLNLASEIVFRMAVTKGYFKPISHGETLLFAFSLSAWYYLLKEHGFGQDPVSAAVKVLIGRDEAASRRKRHRRSRQHSQSSDFMNSIEEVGDNYNDDKQHSQLRSRKTITTTENQQKSLVPTSEMEITNNSSNNEVATTTNLNYILNVMQKLMLVLGQQVAPPTGRHASCPHKEQTCLSYALKPTLSRFLLGYSIQACLKLASKPMQLFSEPLPTLGECLTHRSNINFGLFLMSLVSAGRATSCTLRHYSGSNECAWHGAVSGFVAGLSMLWAPRSSLSMYVMWKAVEQYYLLAAQGEQANKTLKELHNLIVGSIYACSAATILYTFALEPRFVRPSYMKFLDNLSDHRLHQLNRMVLDVFGTGSSVGYEDYFPDLDPKYMSNQFKELVFNWMIQPYE